VPLTDQPNLIGLFVAPLNRLGVTYMVTGALAAGAYGEPRLTNDIDLVIALSEADPARLHSAFDPTAFYVPPLEVIQTERARDSHGHFNIIHNETAFKADVYLLGNDSLHRWAFARRKLVEFDGERVWMAPPEYVIVRKLQYLRDGGSTKHATDVRNMLAVLGDQLDTSALMRQLAILGLMSIWESVTTGS